MGIWRFTYVFAFHIFSAKPLNYVKDLVLGQDFIVGEYRVVQCAGVGHYSRHVSANVPDVSPAGRSVPVACNPFHRVDGIVDTTRRKAWWANLEPPSYVDDSVREVYLLDVVKNILFLEYR